MTTTSNQKDGEIRAEARFVRLGKTVTVVRTRILGTNDKLIVTHQSESKGPMRSKDDLRDAFALAEALRLGSVTPVYKEQKGFGRLKSLVDVYTMTNRDTVRVQNRIKALFRSRGVDTSGKTIYTLKLRNSYLDGLPKAYRASGQVLFDQYDAMRTSKK